MQEFDDIFKKIKFQPVNLYIKALLNGKNRTSKQTACTIKPSSLT